MVHYTEQGVHRKELLPILHPRRARVGPFWTRSGAGERERYRQGIFVLAKFLPFSQLPGNRVGTGTSTACLPACLPAAIFLLFYSLALASSTGRSCIASSISLACLRRGVNAQVTIQGTQHSFRAAGGHYYYYYY